tara:strand:+ start:1565 stop:2824 length:1260 start_codon:yes stop_codon:yes gene_type:complete
VLEQDCKSFEIILINDCSNDKSGPICNSFAEKNINIKVIHNNENQGVSRSRNIGINSSIGRYMIFLDSDDYLLDGGLPGVEKLVKEKNYPDVIVIQKFLARREPSSFTKHTLFGDRIASSNKAEEVIRNFNEAINFYGNCWCHIVKRDLIVDKELIFCPDVSFAEDQEFVAKLFCVSESFAFFRGTFYCKRSGSGKLTHDLDYVTALSCLKIVDRLCKFIEANNFSNIKLEFLFLRIQSILAQFIPQLISLGRSEILQLSENIMINYKSLESVRSTSIDIELFFFLKRFDPYLGLLLYKQSIIEEVILLIEEIGYKELYLFSNNLSCKGIVKLFLNEGYPIEGILDNDEAVAGLTFSGLKIHPPSFISDRPIKDLMKISVLICNQNKNSVEAIYNQLYDIGLQKNQISHKLFHPNSAMI